jgi:hypothetical protein
MASFELGQKVVVITDKGPTYDAVVVARAKGDSGGPGAYKVTLSNLGAGHPGEWHKAADVFLPEPTEQEKKDSWDDFLKEE